MKLLQHLLSSVRVLEVVLTSDSHTIAAWCCSAGRTAEPCKEQVRAAAEALSAHMDEWDIDHGFDREVDNGFHCSCEVGGYTYKGLWAHLARVCLNAAREAVM